MIRNVRAYAYAILTAGLLIWLTPFLLNKRKAGPPAKVDRRARWGVLLIAVAYSLLWQGSFWARPAGRRRIAVSALFLVIAIVLSWSGVGALGRQWRIDAGLSPDHELVQSGPYRFVRHPIYTSIFCALFGTGLMLSTPPPLMLLSILLFAIGTEIRVRMEDRLLASRFGDRFLDYQRRVATFIPFLK